MAKIPFPTKYKKAIIEKTKNTTIRINSEIGKYKKGKIYTAVSYSGNQWNLKIKIKETILTNLSSLSKLKIPKQTINSLKKSNNLSDNSKVEIIKFNII